MSILASFRDGHSWIDLRRPNILISLLLFSKYQRLIGEIPGIVDQVGRVCSCKRLGTGEEVSERVKNVISVGFNHVSSTVIPKRL